ncbi:hypothetical protein J6590_091353 [Homalodisca vitripennis]|nr:hypothetical protein J6590_091353 [Homalodisca vitripennis]
MVDLAPSDYHLLPAIKTRFAMQHFGTAGECDYLAEVSVFKIWRNIYADSHGRDLLWYVNSQQGMHKAVDFVRPGAGSKQVMRNNLQGLHKEDSLVLLCGSNNVAKNESQLVIIGFSDILRRVNLTCKLVLVDLQTRYDLME